MRLLGHWFILSVLFSFLSSCGKDNESGKSGGGGNPYNQYNNPYNQFNNPYNSGLPLGSVNSPYAFNGISVNQVIASNPCVNGFGGMQSYQGMPMNNQYSGQRIPIEVPLNNFPSTIPANDIYVGVTSYGDVAMVVGSGMGAPPRFIAYMCPRAFAPQGQGQLLGVKIGSYTRCNFKPITAATMVLPGGVTAEFRWLDGRSSTGQPFPFCQ